MNEIRDWCTHLKDRGIGVLITDHNVRETLEIIDRAYIMHDGQVLMEGRRRTKWWRMRMCGACISASDLAFDDAVRERFVGPPRNIQA